MSDSAPKLLYDELLAKFEEQEKKTVPKLLYDELFAKFEEQKKDNGRLEEQLAREKKYRILLGFRGRIEHLEKIFDAKNLLNGAKKSREDTWLTIMDKGSHRLLNDLKIKIHHAGLKLEEFCQAIGVIYGDTSDRAAHNVVLPKEIKAAELSEIMELLEIECDESIEAALIILKQKLKLVDDKDVPALLNSSSSDSNVSFKSSPKSADASKSDDENQTKTVS